VEILKERDQYGDLKDEDNIEMNLREIHLQTTGITAHFE
jgi:hypothetical protein